MFIQETESIEELIRCESPAIANKICNAADAALGNEAQFRGNLARDRVFEGFAEDKLGLKLQPHDERTLIRGRADSVYNRFIVEYKAPGVLSNRKDDRKNNDAIKQLRGYIEDLSKIDKYKLERLAGVVTDGRYFIFTRFRSGVWHTDEPLVVNVDSTARFLASLYLLSTEKALTADKLVRDFGEDSNVARIAVSTIYNALSNSQSPKVKVIYDQWLQQFTEVCGYEEGSPHLNVRALADQYSIPTNNPNSFQIFFSIHTYYAIFIKLLAVQVVHYYLAPKLGTTFLQVANYDTNRLLQYLKNVDRGEFFAQQKIGIKNFLEGDFFGWYLEVWDDSMDKGLRLIFSELANYSLVTLDADPDQTRDLLKKLYQNVMPKQIRHDLGEYYTPDWLAERLLNQLGYTSERDQKLHTKRLLDPACGSGTFLVLAIKRLKEHCKDKPINEAEVLRRILSNIVGFDLNPLAVITARTNYLLALGDLLSFPRDFEINLPVYTCDSILTPSQAEERRGGQYRMKVAEERLYKFRTVVGEFAIPESMVSDQYVNALADLVEECVGAKYSVEDFRKRLLQAFHLDSESDDFDIQVLAQLYTQIKKLDDEGINGIWARIIKNAFAPLFCGHFDYVAGNPPWVNWERLPNRYREDTKPLWEKYGLFAFRGQLGKMREGKKDISMLMTYTAMDEYLRSGCKLGFVITQTVFKSEVTGAGFRRFKLDDTESIKVLHVDDLTLVKPFEGAANRTSVLIAEKGKKTIYPVPYTFWRKVKAGQRIPDDTMLITVIRELTHTSHWQAMPIDDTNLCSPWLTGKPKAIRAARKVLGPSVYQARAGSYTGGRNGIYWMNIIAYREDGKIVIANEATIGKKDIAALQAVIEPDLVYPLLRGENVKRWITTPNIFILVVQDHQEQRCGIPEDSMKQTYPLTYKYLKQFERDLSERADRKYYPQGSPFYTMRNVADYTFAPYKVVWREQASFFTMAVVSTKDEKIVIPDHKVMFIPLETEKEAHFVCANLASSIVKFIVKSYVVETSTSTHVINHINVPEFKFKDKRHQELASLSEQAHQAMADGHEEIVDLIEKRIDEISAEAWGLTSQDLIEIQQSLAELGG